MLDTDTFVTTVYVIVDDYCKEHCPDPPHRGPLAGLSMSEVITLALLGQWSRWRSEREFYRFASEHLRAAFPGMPDRSRYNRLSRRYHNQIARLAVHLGERLGGECSAFEVVDCTAIAVRDSHRRGSSWLHTEAAIGHSTRLGWFYGLRLLASVSPAGAITGYCIAAGNENDRTLAEAFFALRRRPTDRVASIGSTKPDVYLADTGFAGRRWLPHWALQYQARVICQGQKQKWPKSVRRWLAHHRQIVETVFEKLHNVFGLELERPHRLDGLQMRLAAKVALHNICLIINRSLDRPLLATADLLGWR